MKWSRASRLFPGEADLLPVTRFTQVVEKTGYDGPWSLEVFNESLHAEDGNVVESHGTRGISGLEQLWGSINVGSSQR